MTGPSLREQIWRAALARFEAERIPGVRYTVEAVQRDLSHCIEFRPCGFDDFDAYLDWQRRERPEELFAPGRYTREEAREALKLFHDGDFTS